LQKQGAEFIDNTLSIPKESIFFEPISSTPTKHFYIYLADSLSISLEQASIQYESFIQSLFDGNSEKITFESLGSFLFVNGILNWETNFVSNNYYSPVHFDRVSENIEIENESVANKDNWVLFASIISIISLLAILYKFFH
jgi:hypothetical protein